MLPWAPATGWLLCDISFRRRAAGAVRDPQSLQIGARKLAKRGYDFVAGLEVEFHIFKLEDAENVARGRRPAGPAA